MTVQLINNQYNKYSDPEYGQNHDVGYIEPWQGEILPKNYTWYGLGQEVLITEYLPLYKHVVKYNKITTEENWQSGMHGLFSDGDGETTFRFPLIQDGDVIIFSDGVTTPVGQKIDEELPNAKGTFVSRMWDWEAGSGYFSGAFPVNPTQILDVGMQSGSDNGDRLVSMNLNKSNSTYKDGGHVRQSGIATRLIIKYK